MAIRRNSLHSRRGWVTGLFTTIIQSSQLPTLDVVLLGYQVADALTPLPDLER
jgi:hypothetical protein